MCSSEDSDYADDEKCAKYAIQSSESCSCHREDYSTIVDTESRQHQLCCSEHEQSTATSNDSQSSRNRHSMGHVYDDDGDMIVRRKCHQQFEIVYIGQYRSLFISSNS